MAKVGVFLAAVLYGASWVVVLVNLVAVASSFQTGRDAIGYLPTLLAGLGVILFVHYSAGWFPFSRKR